MITQEVLKSIFAYENGELLFTYTKGKVKKGKSAGSLCKHTGYVRVRIKGKNIKDRV